jgi:hypothetical protein
MSTLACTTRDKLQFFQILLFRLFNFFFVGNELNMNLQKINSICWNNNTPMVSRYFSEVK